MLDLTKIHTKYNGLVGWKKSINPDIFEVSEVNLATRSGLVVNSNPYCKLEFIADNSDYTDIDEEIFNELLTNMIENATDKVLMEVFGTSIDFRERNLFYVNSMNKSNFEILENGFVGYKLSMKCEKNVAIKISRVLCDFDGTGHIWLFLFNSSQKTPIYSKKLVVTSDHEEIELDWTLDNTNGLHKGEYYIGYFTQECDLVPFKRDYELSDVLTCFNDLDIKKVVFIGHHNAVLPDLETDSSSQNCFGLNFDITTYDDYTDLALQNDFLFAKAVWYQAQIDTIGTYLTSERINRNERVSTNNIVGRAVAEIEGTGGNAEVRVYGLRNTLIKELTKINSEIDRLKNNYFTNNPFVITLK